MRFAIIALLAGEGLLLAGLWLVLWPLTLVALGAQLVAYALVHETEAKR